MRQGLPAGIDHTKAGSSLYEGVEYEQFWNDYPKRKLDELEHAIVRKLLPKSGRRIIDVGCGYGRLADCYLGRFEQAIMVDGSMSLLRQAIEKTKGQAVYIAADARKLPFRTASFDAVLMIRVFHHLEDSRSCLCELRRILCNQGGLVFNYCNKQNAERVMRWLLGARSTNPFSTLPDGVGSTFISHHPNAIRGLLLESGFSKTKYYGAGVMDKVVGKTGYTGKWTGIAELLAPFFAWSRIAPWILCQASTNGNASNIEVGEIVDFIQCPSCGGNLCDEKKGYLCLKCNSYYPVEDGIIDLRAQ